MCPISPSAYIIIFCPKVGSSKLQMNTRDCIVGNLVVEDEDKESTLNIAMFRGSLCDYFSSQRILDSHWSCPNHTLIKIHELDCINLLLKLLELRKKLCDSFFITSRVSSAGYKCFHINKCVGDRCVFIKYSFQWFERCILCLVTRLT